MNALGRTDDAIASLSRAQTLRPNKPEVHFNLANVLFGRHELDAAIDGYLRALALRPNYADALQNLGTALTLRGRLADAVATFRRLSNSPVVFLSIWYVRHWTAVRQSADNAANLGAVPQPKGYSAGKPDWKLQ